jgi:hypothetical protein
VLAHGGREMRELRGEEARLRLGSRARDALPRAWHVTREPRWPLAAVPLPPLPASTSHSRKSGASADQGAEERLGQTTRRCDATAMEANQGVACAPRSAVPRAEAPSRSRPRSVQRRRSTAPRRSSVPMPSPVIRT